ncbi:MAG: carboxypeptidase M32 [Lachnospiraceae bacterium]|nr:carboxypeptidase M32 [Lachnospiraceae bacterium]
MSKALEELQQYLEKMNRFNHVTTLLYWDMRTCAPKQGYEQIGDALAYFSTEHFQMSVSEELKNILETLSTPQEYEALDDKWKFVVKRMKRYFDKNERIPKEVFEKSVKIQTAAESAWEEAKEASDYSIFAPHLEKLIEVTKEIAGYTDPGRELYDALLDPFEEGMNSSVIDRVFDELKKDLIPLVDKILASEQPDDSKFQGKFDVDAQVKVQKMLLDYIGFSWDKGAVGTTTHPFTLNFSSKDVRVTNHYYEDAPISAMFSAIHEGGHAIFEQNVNPDYDGTVAGSCDYMCIHESQSRFYENVLGRNKNFWLPIYDKLGELLPQFKEISLEEFYREINHVRNSYIRTEADEVTYAFHVILRYEIEKAIFREGVTVEELPGLWNAKMEEYLHITPRNDAEGILQDMHWSGGSFGYFPSYLLGSIYDGMLLDTVEAELGNVDEILAQGRILEITKWLNEKIHRFGSTRTPLETLSAVCGKEVTAEPLIRYFTKKYTEIYNL